MPPSLTADPAIKGVRIDSYAMRRRSSEKRSARPSLGAVYHFMG